MSELLNILSNIETAFGIRICVHDVSGITLVNETLELPMMWKTHGSEYCSVSKDYGSEQKCMEEKEEALYNLKQNGLNPFCRICRMGVCEYISPVLVENRLVAVIFASGVASECKDDARQRLISEINNMEFECPELLQAFDEYSTKAMTNEKQLKVFAELIAAYIIQAAKTNTIYTDLPDDLLDRHSVEPVKVRNAGNASIIIRYIEENYNKQISLAALSKRFFLSEGHLNRLVRQQVGMGTIAYVKHLRVKAAQKLLEDTDQAIHDIAEYCGYKDVNYFCRAFKQSSGISPREYREQNARFHQRAQKKY